MTTSGLNSPVITPIRMSTAWHAKSNVLSNGQLTKSVLIDDNPFWRTAGCGAQTRIMPPMQTESIPSTKGGPPSVGKRLLSDPLWWTVLPRGGFARNKR
jgi:hypothetical protein